MSDKKTTEFLEYCSENANITIQVAVNGDPLSRARADNFEEARKKLAKLQRSFTKDILNKYAK